MFKSKMPNVNVLDTMVTLEDHDDNYGWVIAESPLREGGLYFIYNAEDRQLLTIETMVRETEVYFEVRLRDEDTGTISIFQTRVPHHECKYDQLLARAFKSIVDHPANAIKLK